MKSLLLAAVLSFAGLASAGPVTDFTGPYDVANWTTAAGSGSVDTSGAPALVRLTSGAANSGNDVETDFYVTVFEDSFISFDWSFVSADDPFFQSFGYLLGDSPATLAFGDLTSNSTPDADTATVFAEAGQIFGFRAISFQEGTLGATTTIGNFAVVLALPEPGALALVGLALLSATAASRARRVR